MKIRILKIRISIIGIIIMIITTTMMLMIIMAEIIIYKKYIWMIACIVQTNLLLILILKVSIILRKYLEVGYPIWTIKSVYNKRSIVDVQLGSKYASGVNHGSPPRFHNSGILIYPWTNVLCSH